MKVSGAAPRVSSGASAKAASPRPRPAGGGGSGGGGMSAAVHALKSAATGKGGKISVKA